MKLFLHRAFAAFAALVFSLAITHTAAAQPRPQPPEIAARQYILVDLASQQVLAESGADQRAEPASLTKLMTAYLVFNAVRDKKLSLDQALPVSTRAWNERGSGKKGGASLMFIDPKMKPHVDELLHGLIVQSGNDAAVALAEGVAGSVEAFVAAMNKQAEAWGLKNTQFRNVTGLTEPGHYSSARDVAFVAAKIITEHPTLFPVYRVKSYTFNGIKQDNRNRLLARDPTVDGMKTGRTDAAGWCLVATAQRDTPAGKRRLLTVLLGAASDEARAAESHKLLNWGYTAWDAVRVFEPGQALATARVWKGGANEVRVGVAAPLVVSVPKGEGARLQSSMTRTDPLLAPLTAGQAVGTVDVTGAGGAALASVPLVTLAAVPPAGWFGRSWDAMRLWWR
ncbi:MAG: D-alanyl-D-alanine carboxypeptidase [Betaproteobacteria bacterium]|nr:D-alanyl-D-alanine carboxypeptidase [Betaproteobacteria bacterium]MCC6249619.1 D-alanyl-D-alanine carboxypeptidase [Rubrivivax sp.]MCL4696356.1 D-alanyl-D-alanine carboxypeptidase [Burkholderiaceae bacterium]